MRDYLGSIIADGFPPLPKSARVEVRGRIFCDGWPRTGKGIPYDAYELVQGRCGGRFEVSWATIRRVRNAMIRELLASLREQGYKNVELVAEQDCGHADRGQIICWKCDVARSYGCSSDCRFCAGDECRQAYHSPNRECPHDVGARHRTD